MYDIDLSTDEGRLKFAALLDELELKLLAETITVFQTDYEVAKKRASSINEKLDFIKKYTAERMDREGVQNATFPGIGRLGISPIVRASIKAGHKDQAYEWLSDHGHGDLITETVNASSLAALVRREIKEGRDVPEDIFNIHQYDIATVTKS